MTERDGTRAPHTSGIGTMVTVCQWALDRVPDPRARHDMCLHMRKVFGRWAEEAVEDAKRSALEWRPPVRPPSGEFRAATTLLKEAAADNSITKMVDVGQYLEQMAEIDKEKT